MQVSALGLVTTPLPVGAALRSLRAERNLSQQALAAKLHRSKAQIGKWERGFEEPTLDELRLCDLALGMPAGALSAHHSASPLLRDLETVTLRSLLPGTPDLVSTAVHETVRIGRTGVTRVDVQQRVHAIRSGVESYWLVFSRGAGRPRIRVSPLSGCTLGGWPRLLTEDRLAQEIRFIRGPLRVADERTIGFCVTYDHGDNPECETGLHRRVGSPTLAWMKMRVLVPPGGMMIKQGTWHDRAAEPVSQAVHLVRGEQKLLHWDRPNEHTYGFVYLLAS